MVEERRPWPWCCYAATARLPSLSMRGREEEGMAFSSTCATDSIRVAPTGFTMGGHFGGYVEGL